MRRADLELALGWAAREGWNPGRHDAASFLGADPEGFFVATVEGRPVGSISIVRYGNEVAFLGLFIVEPEQRGRGYGTELFGHAVGFAGRRTIGLDGVPAREADYRRWGFEPAWRNVRFEGPARGAGSPPAGLVPISQIGAAELVEWDRRLAGADRGRFLAGWLTAPGTVALADTAGGELCGFGSARPCRSGWKVGPLYARDAGTAERLLAGLAARIGDDVLILDVPEPNREAVALAEGRGMRPSFETTRMYTHPAPSIAPDTLFGVCSFELG